jgi:hypothetical protein
MLYFCTMKNAEVKRYQNIITDLCYRIKKRVLLHFAMKNVEIHSYSSCVKNRLYCIPLQFYCISYCNSIATSLSIFVRLCLHKYKKKCVLLYLIMTRFCNRLKFNTFQKLKITDSINTPLLIHYYSHYYFADLLLQ